MKITLTIGIKQTAILAAILFAILATSSTVLFFQSDTNVKKQTKNQPAKVLSEKISEAAFSNDQLVKVTRVIDGDTIEIEGGQKVRYIGVDTPETVHPDKSIQCFGIEASNKNKELVEGKSVKLEKDVSETDKYGRLLRYVYIGNIFVNDYLVKEGFAYASSYPPDIRFQNQFSSSQKDAEENNRGLWSSCSSLESNPQSSPTSVLLTDQSRCLIKGNISSSGEKIYHMPGQNFYDKTVIDETKGEKWLCSEDEAVKAGWRKSKT